MPFFVISSTSEFTAGSRLDGGMKGINPSGSVRSGLYGGMKGINPTKSARSGLYGGMKGINPTK
ncbi:hypothetical protein, partial [Paenibacillus sp. FSL R10-2736]|uniref:hypothetical protein n=1 Tax=Paenibacillus sp. FSL R10-2736 TaxID=2954692 RepID=UPI0030F6D480